MIYIIDEYEYSNVEDVINYMLEYVDDDIIENEFKEHLFYIGEEFVEADGVEFETFEVLKNCLSEEEFQKDIYDFVTETTIKKLKEEEKYIFGQEVQYDDEKNNWDKLED